MVFVERSNYERRETVNSAKEFRVNYNRISHGFRNRSEPAFLVANGIADENRPRTRRQLAKFLL